jgi:hypothetical protein
VFAPWWQYARKHYLDLTGSETPTKTTLYYDPILDVHHRLPVRAALFSCFYSSAQVPDDARRLFDAASASAGLTADPLQRLRDVRGPAIALALSREWRISDLEARLSRAIDAQFEPRWDHERGEFTWGLGLGEEHPRGQYNAFLATAEAASPGAWTRLSAAPLEACAQVVGVDFPNVALSRALWVNGVLHLRLDVHRPDPARLTTFRILDAEPGRAWSVVGAERSMIERDVSALVVTNSVHNAHAIKGSPDRAPRGLIGR